MKKKNIYMPRSKRVLVISVTLLILSLASLPTPESVVADTTTVSVKLETGWNFMGMPVSISASDLALKSNYITNVVHRTSDGGYVSYVPSLGATDFICEPNEGIYIYSEADTDISFTVCILGYISGDLRVSGDTILEKDLAVNGSMLIMGDFEVDNLEVAGNLIINGILSPKIEGQHIVIFSSSNNSPWTEIVTVQTDSDGSFQYLWETGYSGSISVRASWSGNNEFSGTISATKTAIVIPSVVVQLVILFTIIGIAGCILIAITRRTKIEEIQPEYWDYE